MSNAEKDRIQREKLTEVLGEIVKVLETFNDDDGSDHGRMVAPVMTDEAATRITAAVVNVAKKIEENVRRVVTTAAASPT